jgi:replication factor A1
MEKEEFAPVIKELMTQLAGKATEGQVAKDLDRFVNTYGVTLTAAKNGILKKYGATGRSGGSFVSGNAIIKKITELKGTEMNVDVTGKAIFSEKKEITARGVGKTIVSGILGDDTGTIPFTVWNDMEINKGECYTFRGAYTKKWNDQVQLNIGIRGKVEPAPDVHSTVERRRQYGPGLENRRYHRKDPQHHCYRQTAVRGPPQHHRQGRA